MSGASRGNLELACLAAASLRDYGCEVIHAVDLLSARCHLQMADWNAIVLDAQLPDGGGFELRKNLRAGEHAAPIMRLTGRAFAVCGATYRMLRETRYASHFEIVGDFSCHFGLFPGCGGMLPFGTAEKGVVAGACF